MIERIDRRGERTEIKLGSELAPGSFFDLAKANGKALSRGGIYTASLGADKVTFKVDAKAKTAKSKTGKAPVISRLLRFPPADPATGRLWSRSEGARRLRPV